MRELADTASFFLYKHGNLPDPGEFGEDTLRYFGYHERFVLPFVNETRVNMLKRALQTNDTIAVNEVDVSLWSQWSFNATRRGCVPFTKGRISCCLLCIRRSRNIKKMDMSLFGFCH